MKLCDLKLIGKEVPGDSRTITSAYGDAVLVIDYYGPPPTVELSDGRKLVGETWDDTVTLGEK